MNQTEFIRTYKRRQKMTWILRAGILILIFVLWEIAARFKWIDAFIFSSPSRMARTFVLMLEGGTIFKHIGITLAETLVSFILVMLLGTAIAVILWWQRQISDILEPYLVALNSLPKTALAPILIVWLGNNMKTIIVCGVTMAVFSTIINLYTAFIHIDSDKLLLIRTLGGTRRDILRYIVLPASISAIVSNLKVNIGLCLVGVIIGEFLAANAGLGYLIIYGSQVFRLDYVMLSIIILCILAMVLYQLLSFVEKRYQKKQ